MTEPVKVWRGTAATDPYGNPIQGAPAVVATLDALVAPSHDGEATEVGRDAVITGYTCYFETGAPTGILPTDLLEVRGVKYPVDGVCASWYSRRGTYKGDQVAVRVVSG